MALVHDDEVEEVGRKLTEQPFAALVLRHGLIDAEVHLPAVDDLSGLDLVACVAEGGEDTVLGLVDEDVAVGEVKDAGAAVSAGQVPSGVPQLPADLERDQGLARAGGHGEQQALAPALEHGLHGAVDGGLLVVAGVLAGGVVGGREQAVGGLGVGDAAPLLIALPQLGGRRVRGEHAGQAGEGVELDDLCAVGGVGEHEAQHLSVEFGLLQPVMHGFVGGLGLDHGQAEVPAVEEQVVGALGRLAHETLAHGNDAPVGDRALLGDGARLSVPARRLEQGDNVFSAGIGFGRHAYSSGAVAPHPYALFGVFVT